MQVPQELLNTPAPRPIFAELKSTNGKYTVYTINLFDKQIEQVTTGESHYNVALRSIEQWNEHLDREWSMVARSMAQTMEKFITELEGVGVASLSIEAALEEVAKNVRP